MFLSTHRIIPKLSLQQVTKHEKVRGIYDKVGEMFFESKVF